MITFELYTLNSYNQKSAEVYFFSTFVFFLEDDIVSYKATYENLVDPKIMDKMHWNNDLGIFSDYGNHSTHVSLQRRVYRTPEGNHT